MTDHLPECIYTPERFDPEQNIVWDGKPCICDRLQACEQRSYTLGIEVGKHDGWVAGHAAGVLAARNAVATAPRHYWVGWAIEVDVALAAIDGLMEEKS